MLRHHAYRRATVLRSTLFPAADTTGAVVEVRCRNVLTLAGRFRPSWHQTSNTARNRGSVLGLRPSMHVKVNWHRGQGHAHLNHGPHYPKTAAVPIIVLMPEASSGHRNPIRGRSPHPPRITREILERIRRSGRSSLGNESTVPAIFEHRHHRQLRTPRAPELGVSAQLHQLPTGSCKNLRRHSAFQPAGP